MPRGGLRQGGEKGRPRKYTMEPSDRSEPKEWISYDEHGRIIVAWEEHACPRCGTESVGAKGSNVTGPHTREPWICRKCELEGHYVKLVVVGPTPIDESKRDDSKGFAYFKEVRSQLFKSVDKPAPGTISEPPTASV